MNFRHWLARKFPTAPRGRRAQSFITGAYRRVFTGNGTPTQEDKEIVLADLANYSGFYRVSGAGISAEARAHADGMRAAYGRIHWFLRLTADDAAYLEEAARHEAAVDAANSSNVQEFS